ncbi:MAG: hypothetical protein O3C40_32205, partial [Planctomycetota bacterium]|nr:hypothetical protein [Planctomycetota bacterium]
SQPRRPLTSAPQPRFSSTSVDGYDYFNEFSPTARAGYSICIYHITLPEANRVRRKLGLELLAEQTPARDNHDG